MGDPARSRSFPLMIEVATDEEFNARIVGAAERGEAILDQGWFEFRRQLDYKTAWSGGHLVAVPPQNIGDRGILLRQAATPSFRHHYSLRPRRQDRSRSRPWRFRWIRC